MTRVLSRLGRSWLTLVYIYAFFRGSLLLVLILLLCLVSRLYDGGAGDSLWRSVISNSFPLKLVPGLREKFGLSLKWVALHSMPRCTKREISRM